MGTEQDDILIQSVENVANRLEVPVAEVWKMIDIGELSMQEVNGQWTIPNWSVDYLLTQRSRATQTSPEPRKVSVPPPTPTPEPKKKSKRIDPAKKWKQRFDTLGKQKNDLNRQIKARLTAKDDATSERHIRSLDAELGRVMRELKKHVRLGVNAGFVELPKPPKHGNKKKQPKDGRPKLNLKQLGLQVGLSFSKDLEVLNTFDPRRELQSWEKPQGARKYSYQSPDS